ncbi:hypothetical protein Nepgr_026383 [Nepenthes gracilis]|uniref:GRIP domain-containing protein n=1 Tax=Nepenthes gracilis TaxID=150966 RepID=A0AAD3Y1Z6_NEPGR|nr:hypothetical protein Nepgr_026383 [Nepenthes gracilis]
MSSEGGINSELPEITLEDDLKLARQFAETQSDEGHLKENGFHYVDPNPSDVHDQLVQMIVEMKFQYEYLKSHIKGLQCHHFELSGSSLQTQEVEREGRAYEELEELRAKIEVLSKELLEERQTRNAAEEALKHLRSVYTEADAKTQELSVQLAEAQQKMEQEIKDRDDKYLELDSKFSRLHKRAKQRIQDVQKEKDDLEARFQEVNERAEKASSQLSALQQEVERTRQQASEALKAMDVERQQLRSANNKLRDNIEELRHSLEPKEHALEALQLSLLDKDQMLEDMRGLLQAADEKRQASIAELSAKHQKHLESLEAQLADATSDRNKAAETISSLQVLLAEKESKVAEMDAALSGEAVRLKVAVETVKGELVHQKHEHEKEKERWEATCQALQLKLEAAESNYIRAEVEAAKTRSQLELELSLQSQSLNARDTELAATKEKINQLEAEFSSYKVRAHSVLQKKDAELAAAKDSEQLKALEEALKEAEKEILSVSAEKAEVLKELQDALNNHDKELAARNAALRNSEQWIKNLEMKLDSDKVRYQSEKETWELNLRNLEETWRSKFESLKAQNEVSHGLDLQKEMEELKVKYRRLKEEHDSFRNLADRMIIEKDLEISKLLDENKNLHRSFESRPPVNQDDNHIAVTSASQRHDVSSTSAAEQQILILARQQAQREEEMAQSQRHILALQEEIEELERENRLHSQQVAMLKEELRNMDRMQKREGVDLTYLKNVVLKLLETGEVLALLPVIAMLLQFSPEEIQKCQQAYRSPSDVPPAAASEESGRSLFSRFSFV